MRQLIALAAVVAALTSAGAVLAGGFATVSLDSLPTGLDKGDTWVAGITVLRHGRTPENGAKPIVTIRNTKTGERVTFAAKPTGETGKYEARVVFPSAGTWRYEINNGLFATGYGESAVTTYKPVTIGGGGGGIGLPVWPIAIGALVLALAAGGGLAFRRRETVPAPSL